MKKYIAAHKSSLVETSDFRKILEDVCGLNLEKFFEQWLYSPGFPDYVVSYAIDEKNGMAKIEIEQVNAGVDDVPLFTTPIELLFTLNDGAKISTKVEVSEKKSTFFFSLPSQPVNVNFDPKNWILKKLKFIQAEGDVSLPAQKRPKRNGTSKGRRSAQRGQDRRCCRGTIQCD